MNVAVRTLNHGILSPIILSWPLSSSGKHQFWTWILVVAVLFSAFGLIYIKDINRQLTGNLQGLQSSYQSMHTEWSRLLLENNALSSRGRVEKISKERMGMIIPLTNSVILVEDV